MLMPVAAHKALASKLESLEKQTAALAFKHDSLAANTRAQFKQVIDAIRQLMATPEPKKRPIGFVIPQEKGDKTRGKTAKAKR
jgi:hypothetical protein